MLSNFVSFPEINGWRANGWNQDGGITYTTQILKKNDVCSDYANKEDNLELAK